MDGKAKVELILQLKERVKTGLSKAKDKVERYTGDMKNRLTSLKNSHVQAFRAMRAEIPMFGRAMEILGNPYVLVAAGVLALGSLFYNATQKAADFHHEFLNIRQLNLDKPKAELDAYAVSVKEVAFATGQTAVDTSKAFYDIQSATGLFGKEVADITTKVANFSLATGAQLPDAVNQTVKAMKAFGLGAADIDRLLESNAKTVQVGITTFDELAKVQTEYAGAAAAAGQNVDTANKVFAAFTSIAKNSATAATMTKSAFEGLTQANTVKGLNAMGVSLYDANGEMRDLSAVLRDVSSEFGKMTPQAVDEIIAKIGGPEGLRNMFMKLKTDSADFFKTLEAYDSSKFNLDKALENAKGDMRIISQMAKNRLGIVMGEIGEKTLPMWVNALEKINDILTFVWENFDTIWATVRNVVIALGAAKIGMLVFNAVTAANPIGAIIMAVVALVGLITWLIKKTEGWGEVWKGIKLMVVAIIKGFGANFKNMWDSAVYGLQILWLKFKSFGQYIKQLFSNVGKAIQMALSGNFSGAREALSAQIKTGASEEIEQLKQQRKESLDAYKKTQAQNAKDFVEGVKLVSQLRWKTDEEMAEDEKQTEGGGGSDPFGADAANPNSPTATSGTDSVNRVTASAAKVRNITVNIDSFVKGGINTENTTMQNMDAPEIERYMTDMFMRVIRNLELSGG